jgi:hypothetical protein
VNEAWGRERAEELLVRATQHFDRWWVPEQVSSFAYDVAVLSFLARMDEPHRVALRVLATRPLFYVRHPRLEFVVARVVPTRRAKLERRFPRYTEERALFHARLHLKPDSPEGLTLAHEFERAERAITTEYEWGCYAALRAVLGDVHEALAITERPEFPTTRRGNVRFVCCVESFRRDDRAVCERLLAQHDSLDVPASIALAAGFVDRIPFSVYPFEDH